MRLHKSNTTINKQMCKKVKLFLTAETQLINIEGIKELVYYP